MYVCVSVFVSVCIYRYKLCMYVTVWGCGCALVSRWYLVGKALVFRCVSVFLQQGRCVSVFLQQGGREGGREGDLRVPMCVFPCGVKILILFSFRFFLFCSLVRSVQERGVCE